MSMLPSRRPPSLVASGTARAHFLGAQSREVAEAAPGVGMPTDLRATLLEHDVSDEHLWAASEVVAWAAGLSLEDQRALVCLIVALLDTLDAGGTYLPLATTAADADATHPIAAALRRLGVGEADQRATHSLAAALVAGKSDAPTAALVGAPGSRRPFILSDGALYPERYWVQEERLVDALHARLTAHLPGLGSDDEIAAALAAQTKTYAKTHGKTGGLRLSDEQEAAIRAALTNPLTIITGGPGTGKTSTMVGLLYALAHLGIPSAGVALAAPTGRAAQRMKEAVEAAAAARAENPADSPAGSRPQEAAPAVAATTLHRLLGIHGGRWRVLEPDVPDYYAHWPLPHRIVVVDEASMIDLDLMEQLISAIGPHTRLVLLGDAEQLPSVRVGAVFRDLVVAAPKVTCRLTRSHRMKPSDPAGAEILRVASAVNAGPPLPFAGPPHERATELVFRGFEQLASGQLAAFLERWHGEILAAEASFPLAWDRRYVVDATNRIVGQARDAGSPSPSSAAISNAEADGAAARAAVATLMRPLSSARILCLTREAGRSTSARAVNQLMHGRVQGIAVAQGMSDPATPSAFLPGEPVIVQRNDYGRGLANGDVGIVLRVRSARGDGLGVAFAEGNRFVVHALDGITDLLSLGFALTVHKSQGSEFERVALMLPETDVPLLTRETVYTALTRARSSVVVIGDPAFLARAAGRPLVRTSGIPGKISRRAGSR